MTGTLEVQDLAAWAQHVEEVYIADTLGRPRPDLPPELAAAKARLSAKALEAIAAGSACAVAARFLAVGKPRSLGVLSDDPERAIAIKLDVFNFTVASADANTGGLAYRDFCTI